ncbi:hypothetical protein AX769_20390 [Frondihabitans sp. PAMC 28766]|uniref:hypothetical protein n=1 Tax=Frondihabitans sp. PAMC 28766 TaxID=1795630 RepID=UPI00078DE172|nr:hypothetical protein [Frondihabitans sp. PAMC 28766]AMM22075.1 hypothetical protein AX769_20390 [Frondihabitans sp. PAMC 28766]
MTIINPAASAAATDALRDIELPCETLRCGNGRGLPMRRYSMIDSTLLLVAVQSMIISALLPLDGALKLVVFLATVAFTVVAALVSRRRALHTRAVRDERAAVIRWLAIHSGLDHRSRLALAWAEPQEIGDHQYEFRTLKDGRMLSLIVDLDVQIASFATL